MTCKKTLISIDMHSIKSFALPCVFTQNMLCEVMLTLLRWSYFCYFWENVWVNIQICLLYVSKKPQKTNVECFKAINAQQLKYLTNLFFDNASKKLAKVQNGLLHSGSFSIFYQCCNILNYAMLLTWLKIIRRWQKKKNYKNRIVSIKYIRILNRRSSHYHNKHFLLLLRLNRHNCFRHLAYCYCNLCICKHQYKADHLLSTHTFGCLLCMNTLETPIPTIKILIFDVEDKQLVVKLSFDK